MRFIFVLAILTICIGQFCLAQSIPSTLRLNEDLDYRYGIPKRITIKSTFYTRSGIESTQEVIEYDQLGLPAIKPIFDEEGGVGAVVFMKYDSVRRVLLESGIREIKARFKTMRKRTVYSYIDAKSPVKIEYYNKNDVLTTQVFLKNNEEGYPVRLDLYEPPGVLLGSEEVEYLFERNKAVVSVIRNDGQKISSDTTTISIKNAHKYIDPDLKYNEFDDVIFYRYQWRDGSIHYEEYDYKYDEKNNWVDQKIYEVTYKTNGKKDRKLKSRFIKEIIYW